MKKREEPKDKTIKKKVAREFSFTIVVKIRENNFLRLLIPKDAQVKVVKKLTATNTRKGYMLS